MPSFTIPSPIALGRAYDVALQQSDPEARRELVDALAELRTERQLRRFRRLLQLPEVIQAAIDSRRLTVRLAERLFDLPHAQLDAVAEAIAAGETPKTAVGRFLNGVPKYRSRRVEHPDAAAVRADLNALLAVFSSGHFDSYVRFVTARAPDSASLETLRRAQGVANSMFRRLAKYVRYGRRSILT